MLSRFRTHFLSLFIGSCYPLAFAPLSQIHNVFALLIFPSIAYFFYLIIQADNYKKLFYQAWSFGVGVFAIGISWVYIAINVYGHTPWFLAIILTIIFIVFLGAIFGLQALISLWLITFCKQFISIKNHRVIVSLGLLPFVWLISEWFRSWIFTGFPWLYAGYSQTETILFNYAPIVGVYGVGFITALLSAWVSCSWLYRSQNKISYLLIIPILFIVVALYLEKVEWTQKKGEAVDIALIQGNISQHNRWDKNFLSNILFEYQRLSLPYWGNTDVIIWPENAVPTFYHHLEKTLYRDLQKKVQDTGTSFVTGLPYQNLQTGKYYNSLLRISAQSRDFYYKQHLVPFGEYLPFDRQLRGIIEFFNLPMSGFSLPDTSLPILTLGENPVAISLCYEDSFPVLALQQLPEAAYLLNLSNNGWYGDSFAPHQHLQISRFRAMEAGRELARSTTNGISAFINHRGQIKSKTKQFIATDLTGEIIPRTGTTPYVKYPLTNNLLLILFTMLVIIILSKLIDRHNSINKI